MNSNHNVGRRKRYKPCIASDQPFFFYEAKGLEVLIEASGTLNRVPIYRSSSDTWRTCYLEYYVDQSNNEVSILPVKATE